MNPLLPVAYGVSSMFSISTLKPLHDSILLCCL